jgi:hypothetical protein
MVGMKMIDIKDFTEKMESLNGEYIKCLEKMGMPKDNQEFFLKEVRNIFDSKIGEWKEDPIKLYHFILHKAFFTLEKSRRNYISKHNKKLLKHRGNVLWDSSKGQYKKS